MYFRFVDRDMMIRFHWGLGVGHLYCHGSRREDALAASNTIQPEDSAAYTSFPSETFSQQRREEPDGDSDAENPEFGFDSREDDLIDDSDSEANSFGEEDEELVAFDDMYGFPED